MRGSTIAGLLFGGVVVATSGIAYATSRSPQKDPSKKYFVYRVKPGDTASALALRFFGDAKKWPVFLLEGASKSPGLAENLEVGARLRVPCQWYIVREGDTLSKISASTLGDAGRWQRIYEANRDELPDKNKLEVGRSLAIPDAGAPSSDQKPTETGTVSVGARPFDLLGARRLV